MDEVTIAISDCLYGGSISVDSAITAAETYSNEGSIDSLSNLNSTRAWIFTGSKDTAVASEVAIIGAKFYQHYSNYVKLVDDIPAEHAWITGPPFAYGNSCDYKGSPFVNNCGFDSNGDFLKHLYGS